MKKKWYTFTLVECVNEKDGIITETVIGKIQSKGLAMIFYEELKKIYHEKRFLILVK